MIKLLKGNCLDLLRQLEPGCADLVLIDPPYSSGGLFAGDRKQDTRVKYTDSDFNGAARFPSFSGDNMDQHSFIQFMAHVSMISIHLPLAGQDGKQSHKSFAKIIHLIQSIFLTFCKVGFQEEN